MPVRVTATGSIFVGKPPEVVWDFTQDYSRRPKWEDGATPRVRVRCAGGLRAVFQYRLFDRPRQTSVAMEDVTSFLIEGGGGSWSYEAKDGGTLWTQTNSLTLRPTWWSPLFRPLVARQLRSSTLRAMERAKHMLERSDGRV